MTEKKKKTSIWGLIKESMTQTGGCCGPGESCSPSGTPTKEENKVKQEKNDEQKK